MNNDPSSPSSPAAQEELQPAPPVFRWQVWAWAITATILLFFSAALNVLLHDQWTQSQAALAAQDSLSRRTASSLAPSIEAAAYRSIPMLRSGGTDTLATGFWHPEGPLLVIASPKHFPQGSALHLWVEDASGYTSLGSLSPQPSPQVCASSFPSLKALVITATTSPPSTPEGVEVCRGVVSTR